MSGGKFNGIEANINMLAEDIETYINENPDTPASVAEKMRETVQYLRKTHNMTRLVDLYASGDIGDTDRFLKRWYEEVYGYEKG